MYTAPALISYGRNNKRKNDKKILVIQIISIKKYKKKLTT